MQLILINLVVVATLMTGLWLVSLIKRDASIIDPVWGTGFALVSWVTLALVAQRTVHTWLLAALVTIWGLRLSIYLLWRNHGKGEDRRYRAMRDKHGPRFWWVSLFTVFWLQALILWFVSLTVQVGMDAGRNDILWPIVIVGVALWLIGFGFETIGDYQLAKFKSAPVNQGKVFDQGLWRYTRHPNYFGDFCIWWGLYLVASAAGAWWTVLSPALMSFLLMRVSGVTLLESDIADRRPEYADYQRRTNSFFPRPPRD